MKDELITLYTSRWCLHSRSVETFLDKNSVRVNKINIDKDENARQALIEINNGYASVPTLVLPDGRKLTEPSLSELRRNLEIDRPSGLLDRIRGLFK